MKNVDCMNEDDTAIGIQNSQQSSQSDEGENARRRRQRRSRKRRLLCPMFYIPLLLGFTSISALLLQATEEEESDRLKEEYKHRCENQKNLTTLRIVNNLSSSEVLEAVKELDECHRKFYAPEPYKMDFYTGMVYAASAYTTLGYGDIVTYTTPGRIVTILIAFFGIPLYISFTSDFAELLSDLIFKTTKLIRKIPPFRITRIFSKRIVFSIFITVSLIFVLAVSGITMVVENSLRDKEDRWTYMDSLHFTFASVFLIGFGDLTGTHNIFIVYHLPIIIVGQTLLAMTFYLVTKCIRFVLPRQFSICCLRLLNNGHNSTKTNKKTTGYVDIEPHNPMCLEVESDESTNTQSTEIQEKSIKKRLLTRVKNKIEEVLPWNESTAPIETTTRTNSPFTPYMDKDANVKDP